jgi:hypothetical protein
MADSNGQFAGGLNSLYYLYANTDVLLDLYDTDGSGGTAPTVIWNRYLWDPGDDRLLAQELRSAGPYGAFIEL